ncbi:hypothetical protein LSTR_LSTR006171 [Laodelphax striatellus]|uniref:SKI/SNO/DAC domain-containing protein n=1 Tax=Laodelphax striatellus TaxID=195883 RepID=A0A482XR98_LAOST|nr:hypothetical protein LSTR_LSTR006171 [Laodelphax striatellus]
MDSGSDRSSQSGGSPGHDGAMKVSPSSSPVSLTGGRPPSSPVAPPPAVSTPQGMGPRCLPLPPPGLGLLNSLGGMVHHSPLDLMAVAHHHAPPRSYSSPPPISTSDPTANECKLVDYRGQKVAAFIIAGDTMLCLPQAFELFLKHLVGGLHTVYTKLKRLDIVPLVCNVEQVRILRGLGAIQPGVNRCKLLSCKDFDVLYRDCTTARVAWEKFDEKYATSCRDLVSPEMNPAAAASVVVRLSDHKVVSVLDRMKTVFTCCYTALCL